MYLYRDVNRMRTSIWPFIWTVKILFLLFFDSTCMAHFHRRHPVSIDRRLARTNGKNPRKFHFSRFYFNYMFFNEIHYNRFLLDGYIFPFLMIVLQSIVLIAAGDGMNQCPIGHRRTSTKYLLFSFIFADSGSTDSDLDLILNEDFLVFSFQRLFLWCSYLGTWYWKWREREFVAIWKKKNWWNCKIQFSRFVSKCSKMYESTVGNYSMIPNF